MTFWEHHYRDLDPAWGTRPNAVLVGLVGDLPPGRALDLGCGHGGDALWLAGLGWHVTAVDVAPTALARVAESAREAGVADRVTTAEHDLTKSFPPGAFDLVCASYFHHHEPVDRAAILRRAMTAVVPGGRFALIDHASAAPWSWNRDAGFPTPQKTLAELRPDASWRAEHVAAPTRTATGPSGETATVTDNVILLHRATVAP